MYNRYCDANFCVITNTVNSLEKNKNIYDNLLNQRCNVLKR